ncbi:MAG: shikimate dehydrogenase [Pseudomonadota bacterium]
MKHAFVIGDQVQHSRSPVIHQHWIKKYKLANCSYEAIVVTRDDIEDFESRLRSGEFVGGNVTIPHKETALALADERSSTAQAIGAANTLIVSETNQKVSAHNTDAYGFAANLDSGAPQWRNGKTALVLGAGGAARAIVYAVLEAGYERVALANRTLSRTDWFVENFGAKVVPIAWDAVENELPSADLMVNTTSLGMEGNPPLDICLKNAKETLIVTDIVYVPLQTDLMQRATANGLTTVDGLGMLLHQAVPGFEMWFGVRPEVTPELRALVLADLGATA